MMAAVVLTVSFFINNIVIVTHLVTDMSLTRSIAQRYGGYFFIQHKHIQSISWTSLCIVVPRGMDIIVSRGKNISVSRGRIASCHVAKTNCVTISRVRDISHVTVYHCITWQG